MLYAHCKNRFDFWEVISTHWFRYYLPLCEISRLVKKSIHCFSIPTHPIPWNWRVFPTSSTRSGRSLLFRLFLGPMSRQFLAGQSTWCTQGSQGKEWESKSLLQKLSELQLTSTDFFSTNSYRYRWFSFTSLILFCLTAEFTPLGLRSIIVSWTRLLLHKPPPLR